MNRPNEINSVCLCIHRLLFNCLKGIHIPYTFIKHGFNHYTTMLVFFHEPNSSFRNSAKRFPSSAYHMSLSSTDLSIYLFIYLSIYLHVYMSGPFLVHCNIIINKITPIVGLEDSETIINNSKPQLCHWCKSGCKLFVYLFAYL